MAVRKAGRHGGFRKLNNAVKRNLRTIWTIVLAVLLYNGEVYAQNNTPDRKWSIGDCLNRASAHNIQVNVLRLSALSAQQDLIAARAIRTPSLSGSVSNSFNNANVSGGSGQLINQLSNSGSYSLNSSVTLWNDHAVSNRIRQREMLIQYAGLSVDESINNITFQVTAAYLDILLARENLTYISDLVKTSEARVKQGQLLFDEGSIARKDLLQLQAQLAGDKYLLVQTENAIRQHILSLKLLLQLPTDSLFDITSPPAPVEISGELPPLPLVQQQALQNFPEIRIGKLGLDLASLDIALARAAFKPVLSASAGIGSGYSGVITNANGSKPGFFTQTGNNFYQRLGFTLSIPIFSNKSNKTNLEKANIEYQRARLDLQNSSFILLQNVEQAWLSAMNARQAYAAAREQWVAAEETYRIANEQFKLGAINPFDLLQQRNQYIQAVQAYTQSKYSALLEQKIYEYYMGKPVTL